MLTFLIFFPLLGAIAIMTLPREQEQQAKLMALAVTGVLLAVSLALFGAFDQGQEGLQFTERFRWLRQDALRHRIRGRGGSLKTIILTRWAQCSRFRLGARHRPEATRSPRRSNA